MKKQLTIFFLILFSSIYSQQTIKVTYETISQPKINYNGFNVSESQKEEMERQILQESKKPKKFTLYYNDGNSFFQKVLSDNMPSEKQKTEYFRLKDKAGIYRLCDYVVDEFYGYYPMNNISIEYTDETQTIESFNCKMALYKIGNTVSKVWYTEDIPISAGPYNYYNLPGLVLKVESPNLLCYAVNISKNADKKELKKMNPQLKVYEGDELNRKNEEGKEKMMGNSRKTADELMKTTQKK